MVWLFPCKNANSSLVLFVAINGLCLKVTILIGVRKSLAAAAAGISLVFHLALDDHVNGRGHKFMLRTITIYALIDPNTFAIRYVGRTSNVKVRYYAHLQIRHKPRLSSHKTKWIRMLRKQHQRPIMKILEPHVLPEHAIQRERYWIQYFDTDMLFNCYLPRLPTSNTPP